MGDTLASVREKAQAHQEESKAKRFRDRGGLWQPLSPTKNKLMALLNSAEFENIIEEPSPMEHRAEASTKVPEILHRKMAKKKEKAKSATRANEKGKVMPSQIDDKLAKCVEDEDVPEPPKKKGGSKSASKARSTKRRKAADVGTSLKDSSVFMNREPLSPLPAVKNLAHSPRKVPNVKSRQKQKKEAVEKVDRLVVAASINSSRPDELLSPRRSKTVTKKRNIRQPMAEDDDLSDYRPSPAKKLRTRAAPKVSKQTESTDIRNVKPASPILDNQTRTESKSHMQNKSTPVAKGTGDHSVFRDPSITETPCTRNNKRSFGLLDVDEPSPAKRRRVRSTQRAAKEKSRAQSRTDHLVLDTTSADESLKLSKRKTPVSKASTKRDSYTKTGGNGNKTALDDLEGPLQSGSRQQGCADGHQLSAILEVEEIVHEGQVVCKVPSKGSPSGRRVAGLGLATQMLGITKRRRKKGNVQQESSDNQDQSVNQAVGISKNCSGRRAMSPPPALSESESRRQHQCRYDQRDLPVSKAPKSTTQCSSQPKPKDDSREPVAHSNIGVAPSMKTSKKKKAQAKENELNKECKTKRQLKKPSSSRAQHIDAAMDSDVDELDFLS